MNVKRGTQYVVDASVWLSYLNENDCNHQACKSFFDKIFRENELHTKDGKDQPFTVCIPSHAEIEIEINIRRKRKGGCWKDAPDFTINAKDYIIKREFMDAVRKRNLYDKFSALRPADAVYAMIAHLGNMVLVTADSDFDKVDHIIEVVNVLRTDDTPF